MDLLGLCTIVMCKDYRAIIRITPLEAGLTQVIAGESGFLFLGSDSNSVLEQFEGRYPFSKNTADAIYAAHSERETCVRSYGGNYIHIIVPNKESVLPHLLPSNICYQRDGLTPYHFYDDVRIGADYHDFFAPNHLRRLHSDQITYARLDTHWTHFGAHSYIRECFRKLGLVEDLNALDSVGVLQSPMSQSGDLGRKLGKDDEHLIHLSPITNLAEKVFDNRIANDGRFRVFTNRRAPNAKRLLIHHDSTAEWIIPFLCETYAEVVTVHFPDCDIELIKVLQPNLLVFMQIERFFVRKIANNIVLSHTVAIQEDRKSKVHTARAVIAYLRENAVADLASLPFIKLNLPSEV